MNSRSAERAIKLQIKMKAHALLSSVKGTQQFGRMKLKGLELSESSIP